MQKTRPENMRRGSRAREYGVYEHPDAAPAPLRGVPARSRRRAGPGGGRTSPGECERVEERGANGRPVARSEELAERVWRAADTGGAMFIWQMLLSF
jgi:hypothetical protein